MSFQALIPMLLADADTPASPATLALKDAIKSTNTLLDRVADRFAHAGSEVQVLCVVGGLVVALLGAALLYIMLKRSSSADHVEELLLRLDRLEIANYEANRNPGLNAEIKGVVGYFKQELQELRNLAVGLQQQMSSLEHSLHEMESRLRPGSAGRPRTPSGIKPGQTIIPPTRLLANGRDALSTDQVSSTQFYTAPTKGIRES